jgi:Na+/proline symporter
MNPLLGLALIILYFGMLIWVSFRTAGGETDSQTFFVANRSSKWYLVAFGMIGTSLSGVTFISVPGMVKSGNLHYLQIVLGYLIGYLVIANVLMPLYYRLQLVSIYTYLGQRFGFFAYKTGAAFFILSRLLGSAARFFLVLSVLHEAIFRHFHIPFWLSVGLGLLLIWLYTWKGGIKTIVITDTLQSFCMLAAVFISLYFLSNSVLIPEQSLVGFLEENPMAKIFCHDPVSRFFWLKQILAGAFIAITMTGLDQDMMQKNLTCRSLAEAKKNMYWFSGILLIVNAAFLVLGLMLYAYAQTHSIPLPDKTDQLFPLLALNHFPVWLGLLFLMGIIAATYASTDSALAALTTSFCFDFLDFQNRKENERQRLKFRVHLAMSGLIWLVVVGFYLLNEGSLINTVFDIASITYGPLLGLYALGLYTRIQPADAAIPYLCVFAAVFSWLLKTNSKAIFSGYEFGFEILLVNGFITFLLLWISSFFRKEEEVKITKAAIES